MQPLMLFQARRKMYWDKDNPWSRTTTGLLIFYAASASYESSSPCSQKVPPASAALVRAPSPSRVSSSQEGQATFRANPPPPAGRREAVAAPRALSSLRSKPRSPSPLERPFSGCVITDHRLGLHRFEPWIRKIPWRRKWQPTPVFLPGKSHGQRILAGYSPWDHKESDTTE